MKYSELKAENERLRKQYETCLDRNLELLCAVGQLRAHLSQDAPVDVTSRLDALIPPPMRLTLTGPGLPIWFNMFPGILEPSFKRLLPQAEIRNDLLKRQLLKNLDAMEEEYAKRREQGGATGTDNAYSYRITRVRTEWEQDAIRDTDTGSRPDHAGVAVEPGAPSDVEPTEPDLS